MSFSSLGLSESILKAVQDSGYDTPSPIQQKAIPDILNGHDVMAAAQTGTGKTAGFTLPLLEKLLRESDPAITKHPKRVKSNHIRALILTPTRELAAQVADSVATYSRFTRLSSDVVFGGVKINPQMMRLRKGVDVLVATPGRLLDLHQQNAVKFSQVDVFILDEADRMLDMGFIHDIKKIIQKLPKQRQNLLFSATFSNDIRKLAKTFLHKPLEISVAPANSTANKIQHWICPVDKKKKPALLLHLMVDNKWDQLLAFCKTKHGANKLTTYLNEGGIKAAAIHGNKSQGARTKALAEFKRKKIQVLVATDIAARGLDIDQLPQVVNVDLPNVAEDYIHRIGRTGRAGASGQAVSLVSADEISLLVDIERLIQKTLERRIIDGFEPVHDLPDSKNVKAIRKKPGIKKQKTKNKSTRNQNSKRVDSKNSDPKTSGTKNSNSKIYGSKNKKDSGSKKTSKHSPKKNYSGKNSSNSSTLNNSTSNNSSSNKNDANNKTKTNSAQKNSKKRKPINMPKK